MKLTSVMLIDKRPPCLPDERGCFRPFDQTSGIVLCVVSMYGHNFRLFLIPIVDNSGILRYIVLYEYVYPVVQSDDIG
jgi:hypothetical protein